MKRAVSGCLFLGVQLGVTLALVGCFGNESTVFPPGLDPLGDNELSGPGTEADPHPEAFEVEGIEGGRYDTMLGRGYVHAPPIDVWNAFREPIVSVDRRRTAEWSSDRNDGSGYDDSYVVHHVVHDLVTVEWSVTWRHGVVTGTLDAPELVSIRWQKTEGSTLISRIEGSILLRPVGDGSITEIELVYHTRSVGAGVAEQRLYLEDVYNNVVALAHGEPLPPVD